MLTLVILIAALGAGAQETGEANLLENEPGERPAETDILIEDTAEPEEGGDDAPEAELPGVGFGDFVRMLLVLGFVIALIYAFVWMLRRFSGAKPESEDIIRLHSTRPLKGDAALHVVEVGTRMFLIGSGGGSMNLISEIDDQESRDEIRLNASRSASPAGGGFARMFRDRFGGGPASEAPGEPRDGAAGASGASGASGESGGSGGEDPTSYLRRQRERLKDL